MVINRLTTNTKFVNSRIIYPKKTLIQIQIRNKKGSAGMN